MSQASLGLLKSASRQRLLRWFDKSQRLLPWRVDRDPYRIWISEVMLQQTTVATVIPRFERFLKAFPNVSQLAQASEQEVLKLWEGLGYYSRARNLHRAAQAIMANGGEFVDDPKAWCELPGVGRYILGAVLSQAYDRKIPIVEANTTRLLCRLFGQTGDTKSAAVKNWLWETAEAILPSKRAGDFNQALMELGALICTPRSPNCQACPLRADCVARRDGLQATIPLKSPRRSTIEVREVCIVVHFRQRYLLTRRKGTGRWANMWEFPRTAMDDTESIDEAFGRLLKAHGIGAAKAHELPTVRYSVTHHRMRMETRRVQARSANFSTNGYEEGRWLHPHELAEYPVSSPQRILARSLECPELMQN